MVCLDRRTGAGARLNASPERFEEVNDIKGEESSFRNVGGATRHGEGVVGVGVQLL